MNADEIRHVLTSDRLLQRLAAVEHERWSHWQRYMHEHGQRQRDGSLTIPADLVRHWDTQLATVYTDLSTDEQISDQDQVRRYLPIILEALIEYGA